jgi:hypothetical protein
VGTNKRYAAQVDARMDLRIGERIQDAGDPPFSLSNEELELRREPLTRTPIPVRVRAWVRYPEGPVKVEGEMVAWTPKACAVRWTTPKGNQHKAWVWASAVEQLPPLPTKIEFG